MVFFNPGYAENRVSQPKELFEQLQWPSSSLGTLRKAQLSCHNMRNEIPKHGKLGQVRKCVLQRLAAGFVAIQRSKLSEPIVIIFVQLSSLPYSRSHIHLCQSSRQRPRRCWIMRFGGRRRRRRLHQKRVPKNNGCEQPRP